MFSVNKLSTHPELNVSQQTINLTDELFKEIHKIVESANNPPPSKIKKHPEVKERNGEGMEYLENENFESWEGTIKAFPQSMFFPKTILGIQNLIKWSKENNKRIRISGYRHSSSPMFCDKDDILISTVELDIATQLPAKYPKMNPENELQGIQLIGEPYEVNGKKKILCKLGPATCNYHFLDWVHDPKGGNQAWTLPLNVIMSENTFGGTTSMICHGAGINNMTMSDLVKEIEFINVNGDRQIINDKELLKTAAGCFGLLGIITSITLELDEMTYANFKTAEKKLLAFTVPSIDANISQAIKNHLSQNNLEALNNQDGLKKAFMDFVDRCENYYYAEWFWFPLQEKGWVNCWQNNGEKANAVRYPDPITTDIQRTGSYLAYLSTNILGDKDPIVRKAQTKITGDLAMSMLPHLQDITCTLTDGLHFRKGIQNFKARMMEWEIPVPNLKNSNQADWSICQKAWWAVIETIYSPEFYDLFPMRTTLEMRVMGGSNINLSAQNHNQRTCSIEVLTPLVVDEERWDQFLQAVLDKWSLLKNEQGEFLNIRPHWAKRFDALRINRDKSWLNELNEDQKFKLKKYISDDNEFISIPVREYLKIIAYHTQKPLFLKGLQAICEQGGYTLNDIRQRFSNQFFDDFLIDNETPVLKQKAVHFTNPTETLFKIKKEGSVNAVRTESVKGLSSTF